MIKFLIAFLTSFLILMPSISTAFICGDANSDGNVNLLDILFMINYLYADPPGDPPYPVVSADVNGDGSVNLVDILYMIDFIYSHPPGPAPDCGPSTGTVTDIDGNVYPTVRIGDQWWMAADLKVTHFRNGDPIDHVTNSSLWNSLFTAAYCSYDNDDAYVDTYGRLYNYWAVADERGVAPDGWHVSNNEEWQAMADYLGGASVAGAKLKEAGTVHWQPPNSGSTNETGFTALPGGCRYYSGNFLGITLGANWWSASQYGDNGGWKWHIDDLHPNIYNGSSAPIYGYSIRCVKD